MDRHSSLNSKETLVEKSKVDKAVECLKLLFEKQPGTSTAGKDRLLEDQTVNIFLQISLCKIPILDYPTTVKLNIPHPLIADLLDVCLFTQDINLKNYDNEKTVAHFRELLGKHGICVGQIIPYRQLRTEYKEFEALRNLSEAFDVFLADGRISKMLPSALGKNFATKRKLPYLVKLNAKNLTKEFINALSKTSMYINGHGSTLSVPVGTMKMEEANIVDNLTEVINQLSSKLPGGWDNVSSLYIKMATSKAIPIYISTKNPNEVKVPNLCAQPEPPIEDELNTLVRSRVRVYPSGDVELIPVNQKFDIVNEITDYESTLLEERASSKRRMERTETKEHKEKKTKLKRDVKVRKIPVEKSTMVKKADRLRLMQRVPLIAPGLIKKRKK